MAYPTIALVLRALRDHLGRGSSITEGQVTAESARVLIRLARESVGLQRRLLTELSWILDGKDLSDEQNPTLGPALEALTDADAFLIQNPDRHVIPISPYLVTRTERLAAENPKATLLSEGWTSSQIHERVHGGALSLCKILEAARVIKKMPVFADSIVPEDKVPVGHQPSDLKVQDVIGAICRAAGIKEEVLLNFDVPDSLLRQAVFFLARALTPATEKEVLRALGFSETGSATFVKSARVRFTEILKAGLNGELIKTTCTAAGLLREQNPGLRIDRRVIDLEDRILFSNETYNAEAYCRERYAIPLAVTGAVERRFSLSLSDLRENNNLSVLPYARAVSIFLSTVCDDVPGLHLSSFFHKAPASIRDATKNICNKVLGHNPSKVLDDLQGLMDDLQQQGYLTLGPPDWTATATSIVSDPRSLGHGRPYIKLYKDRLPPVPERLAEPELIANSPSIQAGSALQGGMAPSAEVRDILSARLQQVADLNGVSLGHVVQAYFIHMLGEQAGMAVREVATTHDLSPQVIQDALRLMMPHQVHDTDGWNIEDGDEKQRP